MRFFHSWKDPLAGLPELSSHPSNDSNSSSGWESLLPSVFEDPDQAFELLDKAHRTLDDYARDHFGDDTKAPLNAFLDHLPTKGQEVLAREIVEYAEDHGKLRALRHFLVDAIVKALRVAGGGAPSIGPSPSPGAAAEVEADMASIEVSTKAEQTKLREDCLNRDGQRCVVTGILDPTWFHKMPKSARANHTFSDLECAHILPFALRDFDEKDSRQMRNKATIWWALYR